MIENNIQILIDRSLKGDLNAAEMAQLQAHLKSDAQARQYLADVRSTLDLLQGMEQQGLKQVDWSRLKRGTWRFSIRRNLGIAGNIGLALGVVWSFVAGNAMEYPVSMAFAFFLFCVRAYNEYLEQRSFAHRVDHAGKASDFMDRYAAILRREWKRWRSESHGEVFAAVCLVILALVGNEGQICSILAGYFFVSAVAHHYLLAKPLKQEMAELGI